MIGNRSFVARLITPGVHLSSNDTGSLLTFGEDLFDGVSFVRFFTLGGFPEGTTRGDHGHRECFQLLMPFGHGIKVDIETPDRQLLHLTVEPGEALFVPPLRWLKIRFFHSEASVLVAASHPYNEAEYIRNRDEFFVQ